MYIYNIYIRVNQRQTLYLICVIVIMYRKSKNNSNVIKCQNKILLLLIMSNKKHRGRGGSISRLEESSPIEGFKGLKAFSAHYEFDSVIEQFFILMVQKGLIAVEHNIAEFLIIRRCFNVIHFEEFQNILDKDSSRRVEFRTAQKEMFS